MVGKRFGIGWTLNFGNPRAWLFVSVFLAAIVAMAGLLFGAAWH